MISFRAAPEVEAWIEAQCAERSISRQALMELIMQRVMGAPAVDDVTHGLPGAAVIPGRGARRGEPVEGGGEESARLNRTPRAAPPHPEPAHVPIQQNRGRIELCRDHVWKNMGWGVVCEKCKVQR